MKKVISDFVILCSGANSRILRECENERHKFYPIGLGVIVTASLAFISMMFATHSIFESKSFSDEIVLILFCTFWAFAIFTIDWGLIKTMKKTENSQPTFYDRLKSFFPVFFRLIVAIILSYSISRPMEVKIYEKRLKAQIEKDRQDFVTRKVQERDAKLGIIESQINSINASDTNLLKQKNAGPQTESYKNNVESKKNSDAEYKAIKIKNQNEIANKMREIRNTQALESSHYYDTLHRRRMYQWAINKIKDLNGDISTLNQEINIKKKECDQLSGIISTADSSYSAQFDPLLDANKEARTDKNTDKNTKKQKYDADLLKIEASSMASFDPIHPGLITELESMSNFEKTPEGKSAGWVRFILLLVIICIDTAPIVIKLLTKYGVYEQMVEAEEERLKFLSRHESYANKHLIHQLSHAQREVLSEAIRQWKETEKERDDLSESYINSNQSNNS